MHVSPSYSTSIILLKPVFCLSVRCPKCCIERCTYRAQVSVLVQYENTSVQGALDKMKNWEVLEGCGCTSCGTDLLKKEIYVKHPQVLKIVIKRSVD